MPNAFDILMDMREYSLNGHVMNEQDTAMFWIFTGFVILYIIILSIPIIAKKI